MLPAPWLFGTAAKVAVRSLPLHAPVDTVFVTVFVTVWVCVTVVVFVPQPAAMRTTRRSAARFIALAFSTDGQAPPRAIVGRLRWAAAPVRASRGRAR